jgi:hypothetical protein
MGSPQLADVLSISIVGYRSWPDNFAYPSERPREDVKDWVDGGCNLALYLSFGISDSPLEFFDRMPGLT